ncbi:MAG: endonuclease/exonuclease/phosphatase family protein [Archangiaceae bacterium]|nr:endonuclease/exonuclease/phosphatase family protein [Archangiaceae bacterium]
MLTITTTDAPPRACTGCLAGQLCDGDTGLCGCTASSCASPQTCGQRGRCVSRFKVMQFNILEGAVGNLPNGTPKLDAVVSIIQAVAPDLVTIDEANSTANFATLASRTGMFSNLCLAPNGYHVGVLSKKAFITKGCATPSPVTKAVNLVSVPVGGRTVFVYAVHLTATVGDAGEVYRANEMRAILPLAQHASEPVLIMGDLNSRFPEGTPGGLVTPLLTDARYVDAYREAHPDPVTSGGATGVGGVARIDYIFHDSELVRAVQAEVSNQYTPWPSDHYAVWAVLEL